MGLTANPIDALVLLLVVVGLAGYLFVLVRLGADVLRDESLAGWRRALWTGAIVLLPFVGAIGYLIRRGAGPRDRRQRATHAAVR